MTNEQTDALIDALNKKAKEAESMAQMKAVDYVRTGEEADRAYAKGYLHDAALWSEARSLVLKHNVTQS